MAKRQNYTDTQAAGLKLLGAAIQRNAEAVAKRYENREVKFTCQQIYELGRSIIEAVDDDKTFDIVIYVQQELPGFDLSDEAYSMID